MKMLRPKKKRTWRNWLYGASAVALIVAGIYWKFGRDTPIEKVEAEVQKQAGNEALKALQENPNVLKQATQLLEKVAETPNYEQMVESRDRMMLALHDENALLHKKAFDAETVKNEEDANARLIEKEDNDKKLAQIRAAKENWLKKNVGERAL